MSEPTRRLFWEDPLCEEFEARVLSVEKGPEGRQLVVLDRTAFYPEGGGQPADEGRIGEVEVWHVSESEGVITHHTDRAVEVGATVTGRLDRGRRWDHMQQHSGQHVLSRVLTDEFEAATRGFHLGDEEVTIDLSVELDERQLALADSRVNSIIDADLPITTRMVGRDHPAVEAARRLDPGIDLVRIVEIEGLDTVPCGGTHVPSTSRIGGLHILAGTGVRKHGDLFRISFLCGGRMRRALDRLDRITDRMKRALTTAPEDFLERFEDIADQIKDRDRELEDLRSALVPLRAAALLESAERIGAARVVVARVDDLPAETLPAIASRLTRHVDVAALLGAEVAGTGRLVFARGEGVDADMSLLLAEAAAILQGRGGGTPAFARGGGTEGSSLDTALSSAREALAGILLG